MIEDMKQWLEALEKSLPRLAPYGEQDWLDSKAAITSLRQAIREHAMYEVQRLGQEIEQPKVRTGDCLLVGVCASEGHKIAPQRTWVGLTDDEIIDVIYPLVMADMPDDATDYEIARAIEAKLKEKNT
jgi:hypothetical protein